MNDEAKVAAWHRNVYESYDEAEGDVCPECGSLLVVEREPDGAAVYCAECEECPNCAGPYSPDVDKPVCSECMEDPEQVSIKVEET